MQPGMSGVLNSCFSASPPCGCTELISHLNHLLRLRLPQNDYMEGEMPQVRRPTVTCCPVHELRTDAYYQSITTQPTMSGFTY